MHNTDAGEVALPGIPLPSAPKPGEYLVRFVGAELKTRRGPAVAGDDPEHLCASAAGRPG